MVSGSNQPVRTSSADTIVDQDTGDTLTNTGKRVMTAQAFAHHALDSRM